MQQPKSADLPNVIDAVTKDPALGQVSFQLDGEWCGGLASKTQTGPFTQGKSSDVTRTAMFSLKSDEPIALLGENTAVSPGEYVLQALIACYAATLATCASLTGVELTEAKFQASIDFNLVNFLGIDTSGPQGATEIRLIVHLASPTATDSELTSLVELAKSRSPIGGTLAHPTRTTVSLSLDK